MRNKIEHVRWTILGWLYGIIVSAKDALTDYMDRHADEAIPQGWIEPDDEGEGVLPPSAYAMPPWDIADIAQQEWAEYVRQAQEDAAWEIYWHDLAENDYSGLTEPPF